MGLPSPRESAKTRTSGYTTKSPAISTSGAERASPHHGPASAEKARPSVRLRVIRDLPADEYLLRSNVEQLFGADRVQILTVDHQVSEFSSLKRPAVGVQETRVRGMVRVDGYCLANRDRFIRPDSLAAHVLASSHAIDTVQWIGREWLRPCCIRIAGWHEPCLAECPVEVAR